MQLTSSLDKIMTAAAIANTITLILQAANQLEPVVESTIKWLETLFSQGVITKEEQETLMTWMTEDQEAALDGEIPESLNVDPDPES